MYKVWQTAAHNIFTNIITGIIPFHTLHNIFHYNERLATILSWDTAKIYIYQQYIIHNSPTQ